MKRYILMLVIACAQLGAVEPVKTVKPELPASIERAVVVRALRNSADRLKLNAVIMGTRTFAPDGTVRITPDPIGMAKAEALYNAADVAEKLGFVEEQLPNAANVEAAAMDAVNARKERAE